MKDTVVVSAFHSEALCDNNARKLSVQIPVSGSTRVAKPHIRGLDSGPGSPSAAHFSAHNSGTVMFLLKIKNAVTKLLILIFGPKTKCNLPDITHQRVHLLRAE